MTQQWYAGGAGANLQTVEGGVQVYPRKYGTNLGCLFIYWTSANYTNGCYNLDCSAFVQTDNRVTLGAPWAPEFYSTPGGTQYQITMQWQLYQNNWWLLILLDVGWIPVGYYPQSLYGSGQLASYATSIDYGGETIGISSWPPMGSGAFASAGWQYAAYQNQIFYIDTSGASVWSGLTTSQPSPLCYTLEQFSSSDSYWGKYFFFGGLGGSAC